MVELFFIAVVGTSIWVWVDSAKLRSCARDVEGLAATSPVMWFLCCILMWIIAFPLYLLTRPQLVQASTATRDPDKSPAEEKNNDLHRLEKLGDLRERGILTEDEFLAQKSEILGVSATVVPPYRPVSSRASDSFDDMLEELGLEDESPSSIHCDCGKKINYKPQHRGKRAKCPACNSVLNIP